MRAAGEPAPVFVALPERAEDLADEPDHRERWRFVLARAVGSLSEVVELAVPLLAVGGHLVAWKRDSEDGSLAAEVRDARALVRATGAADLRVQPVLAGGRALHRHVLVSVGKVRPTPDHFPRPPAERRRALC
jgi:16S rRNA (guanine527-N7)-methyltransferase